MRPRLARLEHLADLTCAYQSESKLQFHVCTQKNTNASNNPLPRSHHEVYIDEAQVAWLEQLLADNAHRPVVVYTHAPPIGCGLKVRGGLGVGGEKDGGAQIRRGYNCL